MCGLLGIFSDGKKINIDKFNRLTDNSRIRGRDATGFLVYNSGQDYGIMKEQGPELVLPNYPDISKSRCIVGHVRKATIGHPDVNSNNHPFKVGRFIGFHNGTCESSIKAAKEIGLGDFVSDSLALMSIIEAESKDKDTTTAIKTALSYIEKKDTFSLIVFDTNEEAVYFAREAGRPLIMCPTVEGLAIASESVFFNYLYVTGDKYGIRFIHTSETKPDTIYRMGLDDLKLKVADKFEQKAYPGYASKSPLPTNHEVDYD